MDFLFETFDVLATAAQPVPADAAAFESRDRSRLSPTHSVAIGNICGLAGNVRSLRIH